jgi:hypothetical protein
MKREITTVAATALCASAAMGQFTYQYDDGTGGNAGPGPVGTPGMYVWGNNFNVQNDASEIVTIQIAVGRIPAGATLTALLFEDPNDDGNPDDGVLLTAVTFTPTATQSNTFTDVPITPTRVVGRFYVACSGAVDGTSATYLARTDFQTGQANGTNTFFYWGPNLNPYTLTGWSNRAQYTGVATAMVRAVGRVPAPPCPADIGMTGGTPGSDGLLDNNDFVVYIDRFFAHDASADVGSTGGAPGADGAWDNNDFIVFIDQFFAGCWG